jgi:hypothetical protein
MGVSYIMYFSNEIIIKLLFSKITHNITRVKVDKDKFWYLLNKNEVKPSALKTNKSHSFNSHSTKIITTYNHHSMIYSLLEASILNGKNFLINSLTINLSPCQRH